MGLTHLPGHLSGSQSSLASEMGTGSADPQRGPLPQADLKGRGKKHTWMSPQC
ncbi:hypothetical protein H8959_021852 [Pygathrix nigripes]